MARLAKLVARAGNNPQDVRFSDLLAVVEAFGFVPIQQRGGSHRRYVHPVVEEYLSLQPDPNGKAKPYQVKQVFGKIDRHGLHLEDDEP